MLLGTPSLQAWPSHPPTEKKGLQPLGYALFSSASDSRQAKSNCQSLPNPYCCGVVELPLVPVVPLVPVPVVGLEVGLEPNPDELEPNPDPLDDVPVPDEDIPEALPRLPALVEAGPPSRLACAFNCSIRGS